MMNFCVSLVVTELSDLACFFPAQNVLLVVRWADLYLWFVLAVGTNHNANLWEIHF